MISLFSAEKVEIQVQIEKKHENNLSTLQAIDCIHFLSNFGTSQTNIQVTNISDQALRKDVTQLKSELETTEVQSCNRNDLGRTTWQVDCQRIRDKMEWHRPSQLQVFVVVGPENINIISKSI